MTFRMLLEEIGVEVTVDGTRVTSHDMVLDEMLDEMILENPVTSATEGEKPRTIVVQFPDGEEKVITVHVIKEVTRLNTGAEYILDLQLDHANHGYYFGLYEMGEFKLSPRHELCGLKRRQGSGISNGRVLPSDGYVLLVTSSTTSSSGTTSPMTVPCKGDWNEETLYHWKHPLEARAKTIEVISKTMVIVGLGNGKIVAWDVTNEQKEWELAPFSSWVMNIKPVMMDDVPSFLATSDEGELAFFSGNGALTWSKKVSSHAITAIEVDESQPVVHCIDDRLFYHQVDLVSGAMVRPSQVSLHEGMTHSQMAMTRK